MSRHERQFICPHCKDPIEHCPGCGAILLKPRSLADHNRYFALVSRAFFQWPEGSRFKPESAEHLRAWLQVEAGHCRISHMPMPPLMVKIPGVKQICEAFFRSCFNVILAMMRDEQQEEFMFVDTVIDGDSAAMVFRKSKSIAHDAMPDQKQFGELRDKVTEIIEVETGVTADELLDSYVA